MKSREELIKDGMMKYGKTREEAEQSADNILRIIPEVEKYIAENYQEA